MNVSLFILWSEVALHTLHVPGVLSPVLVLALSSLFIEAVIYIHQNPPILNVQFD